VPYLNPFWGLRFAAKSKCIAETSGNREGATRDEGYALAPATSNGFEVSIALLKVTHRKKLPSGLVHVASAVGPGNVNGGDSRR
jgi:hypothetical protein